jgi:hypothetical protein
MRLLQEMKCDKPTTGKAHKEEFMNARNTTRKIVLSIPLLMVLAFAGLGWAQEEEVAKPEMRDRWGFTVGDYFFDVSTDVKWDIAGEPGTDINWEDDLGFDVQKNTFRFDGFYRFNTRHRLDFQAFTFSRSGDRTIEEDIVWGGVTYQAGAYLEAKASVTYFQLMYGYSFVNNDQWEFGLAGGLSALQFKAQLAGEAWVDDQHVEYTTEKKSITAPVPVFGPYLEWRFARNFDFLAHAYLFTAQFDKYDANIGNLALGVNWFPTEVFGVGVQYNYQKWDIGVEADDSANAKYTIQGWHAFLAFRF